MNPKRATLCAAVAAALYAFPAAAQTPCRTAESSVRIALPGHPYAALVREHGCVIFVSTQNTPGPGGISVIAFEAGTFTVKHSVPLAIQPAGLVFTHDGKLLIAPGVDGVAFLDVAKLTAGGGDSVLAILDDGGKGPSHASVTDDDKLLFVSDERSNTVTLIDLSRARANGFNANSIIGKIPTANQPVGMALSPDQQFLYIAAEVAKSSAADPASCKNAPRGGGGEPTACPAGVLTVVDVAKARMAPVTAVVAEFPAGCRPVRVILSRNGTRAYVAARASNEIVAFDATKAQHNDKTARLASVTIAGSAIGIALSADGSTVFASNDKTLTMISTLNINRGSAAIKSTMAASGAGRELSILEDGKTLLLTNYADNLLEIIDLARLPQ